MINQNTDTSSSGTPFVHTRLRKLLVAGILALLLGSVFAANVVEAKSASPPPYIPLAHTVLPIVASDQYVGHHNPNAPLTIELALHPRNQAALDTLIASLYDARGLKYHKWLPTGAFATMFAPTNSQLASVRAFLSTAGLHVVPGAPSPFILRVGGRSGQMELAFRTTINDYRSANGTLYFANATAIQIPASLSGIIDGVVGLDNITHAYPHSEQMPHAAISARPRFGGGPGGGLTPSQIAGIYLAKPLYNQFNDFGQGKTLAVFELAGYTASDIPAYCSNYSLNCPPLTDINVDGGPTSHNGAGEVELDIELQIALAPSANGILVYNSPNTGQGVIDEYARIAADNSADSISTSWGLCEAFSSSGVWDSEFTSFEQMAVQGQSIFAAAGDSGAFDCLPHGGGSGLGSNQVDDPASNPYMTGVGGTSLAVDPGSNPNPAYVLGEESEWNNGCTSSGCSGAGGGGNSRIWAKPGYQAGPGVVQSYSKFSPWCTQPAGTQCREVPDVSMNADPNTGYSIYCTDLTDCGGAGWLQFGGTSCAAPLWAAIIGLTDSRHSNRLGEPSFVLYSYDSTNGYTYQFHDITSGNNGWFPARTNYDLATGIGTPKIYYLATSLP